MTRLIVITPIEYLKVILDANFGIKRELSLLFHLQQIGFGRTNQNYQELFNFMYFCDLRNCKIWQAKDTKLTN